MMISALAEKEEKPMINAWWLLLIVPVSASFGFILAALLAANGKDEKPVVRLSRKPGCIEFTITDVEFGNIEEVICEREDFKN